MPQAIDRPRHPALAAALALLPFGFAVTTAAAQSPTSYQMAPYQMAQAQQKPAPARQAQQPPQDPGEAQIADLKKRLAITPAQQPQFDAFAQVVRQNAQEMNTLMAQEQQKQVKTAVDDLRSSVTIAQAEADGLKRMLPALEALYASLSDPQKRTADQMLTSASQQQPPPPQKKKG